jgi:hypothetical protein
MTKLKYIGRQELPPGLDIDARMWNIEGTDKKELAPFIGSTRMLDGLRELGIVRPIRLGVI